MLQLHAIVGDTTTVREDGVRLLDSAPWRSPDHPFALTFPLQLANAFALVGDTESANRVLLELAGLMREQASERALPDTETSSDAGVFFFPKWLHNQCETPVIVRQLPAYPDVLGALRGEEQRRRELYGS